MRPLSILLALSLATPLATGCADIHGEQTAGTRAYAGIAAGEKISFTGTEPFWGGEVEGDMLQYSTPENIEGVRFPVERFAGNNGVSLTGTTGGRSFDLMVTPGLCSDGMSDRRYPFVATLKLGEEEIRRGCAWTERMPYTGDPRA